MHQTLQRNDIMHDDNTSTASPAQDQTVSPNVVREITDTEVEHFRMNGWVRLKRLVSPEVAAEMLRRLQHILGTDTEKYSGIRVLKQDYKVLRNYVGAWRVDPYLRAVVQSPSMGRVAARLLGDKPVRFFHDELLVKKPATDGFKPTGYHQDAPYHAFDRSALIAVWLAVDAVSAARGSMRFLEGSQNGGSLGRFPESSDMLEAKPEIATRFPLSAPFDLEAGDATAHSDLTIHGAPANHTDKTRWAYLVKLFDADARYSGAQTFDDGVSGTAVGDLFNDKRYPIIYPNPLAGR